MAGIKKVSQAYVDEISDLIVKCETAKGWYVNAFDMPMFIKNPELQQVAPVVLPRERMEKYRSKLETFIKVLDEQIKNDTIRYADQALEDLKKRIPDYTFRDTDITEYPKPVVEEENDTDN